MSRGVLGLIADRAEIDGGVWIDRLGPVQPLQALVQLAGAIHHLAFRHVGQQHGKHLAGIAGLQGTVVLAHEGGDGGARLHQQILALAAVQLGIQLLQAGQLDQQHAATHHARLHDGALQPVVEEQPIADAGHLVDEGVAADEVVEAAALLAGIRQLGQQIVEGLAGRLRPLVGRIMGQLGELVVEDQLGALGQQLGPQLQPQPANRVPEAEHHDEDAEEMPDIALMEYSNSLNGRSSLKSACMPG